MNCWLSVLGDISVGLFVLWMLACAILAFVGLVKMVARAAWRSTVWTLELCFDIYDAVADRWSRRTW